ncbi:exopolysaccharide biosynthesis protein [Phenylobacterium sp. LH3H17]|uniref:exopolysaccharide biosynthesis protein n=1 Tax=Phenylobacterium sp. LH3H17 TaxID=2903901 RepID=UPI0020CA1991|nr:exopolysaccharide biosynthesis protein [Phenylobacterium sp. LH3H17]UTP39897.1 exopolysaccharide biosynthesis protein [Phenylobacterium sp. LH3H17]
MTLAAGDHRKPISQILRDLGEQESLSVGEVVDLFGRRAFGALMFVFSIPNLLPLPPGSSTLLGAPLLLLSPQVALGISTLWLPRIIDDRKVTGASLHVAFNRLLPWVERIEQVSRPRLTFMFGPAGDRIIGVICTLLSFVLILPIPLGNLLPALTIGVLGFSLFQRDGVFALLGYALAAVSGAVLFVAADLVIDGVRHLVNWFGAA